MIYKLLTAVESGKSQKQKKKKRTEKEKGERKKKKEMFIDRLCKKIDGALKTTCAKPPILPILLPGT